MEIIKDKKFLAHIFIEITIFIIFCIVVYKIYSRKNKENLSQSTDERLKKLEKNNVVIDDKIYSIEKALDMILNNNQEKTSEFKKPKHKKKKTYIIQNNINEELSTDAEYDKLMEKELKELNESKNSFLNKVKSSSESSSSSSDIDKKCSVNKLKSSSDSHYSSDTDNKCSVNKLKSSSDSSTDPDKKSSSYNSHKILDVSISDIEN